MYHEGSSAIMTEEAMPAWIERSPLVLTTARALVVVPTDGAARAMAEFESRNRAHFARWDPPRPDSFFTEARCARAIDDRRRAFESGSAMVASVVMRDAPHSIGGFVSAFSIERSAFLRCQIAYGIDAALEGRGVMAEVLSTWIDHLFSREGLHRLEAAYVVGNERSARLLERLDFAIEGRARGFAFVAGAWRDHVLTARINPHAVLPSDPSIESRGTSHG
jgi:ribosomal-protein-alanine N-acetyltransferase